MNLRLPKLLLLLFMLCSTFISLAQERKLTGKVTDKSNNNAPLPGVSIKVKNGTQSASTDADGNFSITVPSNESIITFTHVGFGVVETKAGPGTLSIQMESLTSDMNEVIVVGYGNQKKSHLTGAVESIKGKEIEDLPIGNLSAGLSGRILGVNASGGMTRPGTAGSITIRNPLSLAKDGGNNSPLIVIDGVIQVTSQGANDLTLFNSLDPSEVESISFLKDGAAAIYGSRAANGAVILTTKRGQSGKPRINYSGSVATNNAAYTTKMMNPTELMKYVNIVNGPNGANENATNLQRFFTANEQAYFGSNQYDWLSEAWQSSYNTRHAINVSGGSDRATYFANVSYYAQNGNIGKLDHSKWTYRAGADVTVASGLKVGLQIGGVNTTTLKMNSKIGGENAENDYRMLLRMPSYIMPYINGKPVRPPGASGSSNLSAYHFFELTNLNNFMDQDDNAQTVNLYAEYEAPFLKGLKARLTYGRNSGSGHDARIGTQYRLFRFRPVNAADPRILEGASVMDSAMYTNDNSLKFFNKNNALTQTNFTLTYSKTFGQHTISALASIEKSESESTQEDVYKENPSVFTNGQFNTAFGAIDGRTAAYESGNLGYIGRVNYSYGGKYLAEFLFRTDASNKFAPANYFGKFYSISAGWIVSSEDWFKSSTVNFLKVRYSAGLLGKDDTRAWQWRQRFTFQNGKGAQFGADNVAAGIGMKMEVSPNPDVTWSQDFKQNLGIDARFLRNRLSATVEVFYNKGTGLLIERTGAVPVTVGGSIASENYGKVNFYGTELSLGWDDNIGRDFTYGISTRFSWADNKVKQGNFNPLETRFPWNAQPNRSADNGVWGYDYLGMFTSQADIDAYVSKYNITSVFGRPVTDLRPGSLYYRDVRGPIQADGSFAAPDGIIDNNDQVQLAKRNGSTFAFGSTIKAGHKSFAFEAVIVGSWGGWSELDARSVLERNIDNLYQNGPKYWADVYDPVMNPTGKYPNPFWGDFNTAPRSNFWRVNSFRLRVRNASLSYGIPKNILEKAKLSSARVVLTALNPLNLYNPYNYKDSEGAWDIYPVLRTFSVGVNVTL
jgi:TonB-linked SusC/RagA family outer membrane protein